MPVYAYKCPGCGRSRDIVKPLALLNRFEFCGCGAEGSMERQISAVRIAKDYAGYSCPVSGEWIEGRRAHENNLARHGCRVLEPGETQENERRRVAEETAFDNRIGDTVEGFVQNLPTTKREQLAVEIAQGADMAVTRTTVG